MSPPIPATDTVTRLLHGYSFVEWPDLSAIRRPLDHIYTTEHSLPLSSSNPTPHILLAISRILGVYCGALDIIVAVSTDNRDLFTFIRVAWTASDTRSDILDKIEYQVQANSPTSLSVLRNYLELGDTQPPCVVLFSYQCTDGLSGHEDYPLVFSYNALDDKILLTSSTKNLHPSVSSQILSQVALTTLDVETHPTMPMSRIDLPPRLLSQYERTRSEAGLATAYPHFIPLPFATDYLARRSRINPNSTAIEWHPDLSSNRSPHSLSYLSFHRWANQAARWLRKLGLQSEDRVAVCMARNILFHVIMFGIMRAGGCYVPIDPDLPPERKAYIARDSDARFVITTADVSPRPLFGARIVFFEDESIQTAIKAESYDEVTFATPEGLAFLLYTSGTTGNPKGCLLTNEGLSQAIIALSSTAAEVRMPDLSQGRYLAVASVAFDVHLAETFVPIALGMPLLSAPRSQLLENLPFHVKHLRITHLGIVPSLIEATLSAINDEDGQDILLRYIASGGEKMSDAILDKWANHSQVRLANFYGPSEVTIGCCARFMDPETPRANIGRSFANVASYVVDANLRILPLGGIGELVVEGPLVGRGYIGRPDLTGKVFLEWPQKGDWAYRTGDLVRMMPDSTFEILGRIDSQIKLRGVRIESEGISSIIRRAAPSSDLPLDATTILGKHPSIGSEQLVSFVTWDQSIPVSIRKSKSPCVISSPNGLISRIRLICETELARYMRPSHIIPLNWLPLSSNGKADIKVLTKVFHAIDIDDLTRMADMHSDMETRPLTPLEEAIFTILCKHTIIPRAVALPDLNIFACGLDSMAVIRFAKDLFDEFGHRVSASDIMSMPTLAGIASLWDCLPSSSRAVSSYTAQFSSKWLEKIRSSYGKISVEYILPPLGIQEGVLARSADDGALYVQHVIALCKERTSMAALQRSWHSVMTRHPILRTVFFFSNELAQVILTPARSVLPWTEEQSDIEDNEDFVKWFWDTRAQEIARHINATLSESPPFKLSSFVGQSKHFLVLSIHHALYDGISLPLLIQDVERDYHGLPSPAAANASTIVEHMALVDHTKARNFWLDHFSGFDWPPEMTPSQSMPSQTVYYASQFRTTLASLKELAASQAVTPQTVLTTTFAIIAGARIYQAKDVSIGIIRSGRLIPAEGVQNAILPLVSIVPTRINFNGPGNILHNVQSHASAIVEVEHIPLNKVQQWIRPGQATFDLLFSVSIKADVASDIWSILRSHPPEADYALSVEIVLDPDHDVAIVQAAWKNGYFDDEFVQKFVDDFEAIALDVGAGKISHHLHLDGIISTPHTMGASKPIEKPYNGHIEGVADLELIAQLRRTLSEFLALNEEVLTPKVSFVSLGLDSIKSVGLARALRKLGHNVRAEDMMKFSSLLQLAHHITSSPLSSTDSVRRETFSEALRHTSTSSNAGDFKLSPVDKVTLFPTTILQAGMLSQTISSNNGSLYLHAFPLQLSPEVRLDELEKAWMGAIELLDILRTSFHFNSDSGVWVQAVHSHVITKMTRETFETKEDYDVKLSSFLESIKLSEESYFHIPPIWLRLFVPCQSSQEMHRFVLVMHHALYDGVSVDILLDLIHSLYFRLGNDSLPAIQQTQFQSLLPYILDQEAFGTSFWIQALDGFCPTYLHPRADISIQDRNKSHAASRTFFSDPRHLKDVLRYLDVTVQCLGQVAWGKLMAELSGCMDVVFGHNVSGRTIPNAEGVIGPVLNTIPCRVTLLDGVRNVDLLRSIHKRNVEALPWQHASLRSIQRKLGLMKLWDSIFIFQPYFDKGISNSMWTLDISAQENRNTQIQYPFAVELHQNEDGFTLKAACRQEYMDQAGLEALLARFQERFESLMVHLDSIASEDIPIIQHNNKPTSPVSSAHEVVISPPIMSILTAVACLPAISLDPSIQLATLGIDSITAIQIVSRFKGAGLALSTNDIITSRTIGDMIAKVRPWSEKPIQQLPHSSVDSYSDERAAIATRIGSSPESIQGIWPLSSGMKWFIGSWQKSERTAFHHAFAFRLPAEVEILKLERAWKSLLGRHPLLRSTFACASGDRDPRIVSFIMDACSYTWVEERITGSDDRALVANKMREVLTSPPSTSLSPTKAILCRLSEASYLVIHLHHFQYDAWSLPLILDDLSRFYFGLEPLSSNDTLSFSQLSDPHPENLSMQKRYWQETLGQKFVPVLFPSLHPSVPRTHERTLLTVARAISDASRCAELARSAEVSLPSLILACWAAIQGRYCVTAPVTFGLWQAGRSDLLDDKLALPCLNVLPLHVAMPKEGDVIATARAISSDLQGRSPAIIQSDLVNISEWVGAGEKPLFNVVVNVVPAMPETTTDLPELLEPLEFPYYVPSVVQEDQNPTMDQLAITDLIQNDLIIDFAVLHKQDRIMMSIDAGAHIMDEDQAGKLVEEWANMVKGALGIL